MQVPELGKYMENGINIDPVPLTMEQFATAGNSDGKVSLSCVCYFFYVILSISSKDNDSFAIHE